MATAPEEPRTANQVWANRVATSAEKVGFRHRTASGWVDVTWRQADVASSEVAGGLAAMGLLPGDRVCILSQTRLEWLLADIGILKAGGATVPIYPSSLAEQCAFIVKDSGATWVFAEDAAQVEKLLPLLTGASGIKIVHIADDAALEKPDARGRSAVLLADVLAAANVRQAVLSLDTLREKGRAWLAEGNNAADLIRRAGTIRPADLFTIIYTSGTTGMPKGAVLSHQNLVSACQSGIRSLTIHESDLQYLFLPLAHVLGREMEWCAIMAGSVVAFSEGIAKIKDNLVEVRPTFMAGVPRIFEKFYGAVLAGSRQGSAVKKALVRWAFGVGAAWSKATRAAGGKPASGWLGFRYSIANKLVFAKLRARLGLDRCRFLISGGAPLAGEIAEFFHAAGLLILEGYGLTETMAAAFVNTIDRYRFATVGPAIDVIECKIADDGEILMRGPSVFRGYHNNPTATAEAIDADGWFHSGDIGHLEDGFLRITDRKKDLIVTAGGKKVAPQMIENLLKVRSTLISQALVHGDKRPYCVAVLTASEEAAKRFGGGDLAKASGSAELKAELQTVITGMNANLASYEGIKKFAILPADFSEAAGELTPSLKIKRKVVTEKYRSVIEGLYAGNGAAD